MTSPTPTTPGNDDAAFHKALPSMRACVKHVKDRKAAIRRIEEAREAAESALLDVRAHEAVINALRRNVREAGVMAGYIGVDGRSVAWAPREDYDDHQDLYEPKEGDIAYIVPVVVENAPAPAFEHKLYSEKASEVRTLLSGLYDGCVNRNMSATTLTFGQLCDVMNLLEPNEPAPGSVTILHASQFETIKEELARDPVDPEPEGTADDLRPLIEYPARRLTLTLTHPTIGEGVFTSEVLKAMGPFLMHMAACELPTDPYSAPSEPRYPFTAPNGVVVDVLAWKTVDEQGGLPAFPFMDGDEQLTRMTETIRAAAIAVNSMSGLGDGSIGTAPAEFEKAFAQAVTEGQAIVTTSFDGNSMKAVHIRTGDKNLRPELQELAEVLREQDTPEPRPDMLDTSKAGITFSECIQIDPKAEVSINMVNPKAMARVVVDEPAEQPITIDMDKVISATVGKRYTFDEFIEYGRARDMSPRARDDMPWSFHFHGWAVTHETDTRYLINSSDSVTHHFNKGDEISILADGSFRIHSAALETLGEPSGNRRVFVDGDIVTVKSCVPVVLCEVVGYDSLRDLVQLAPCKVGEIPPGEWFAPRDLELAPMSEAARAVMEAEQVRISGRSEIFAIVKPTIGRRVWFRPDPRTGSAGFIVIDYSQPLDAGIVWVWSDTRVNLDVTDHNGNHHAMASVYLVRPGEPPPPDGSYAEWMPYQIKQAAK